MLGNAAGENDVLHLLESTIIGERRRDHQRTCHRRIRTFFDNLEKDFGHVSAKIFFHLVGDFLSKLDLVTHLFHHDSPGIFDAGNLVVVVESDQPRAHVDRSRLGHDAVFNE